MSTPADTWHDGRFARLERLVGAAGLERLSGALAVVVGLGAVGSYAVEALARAGVGRLRVVDFDVVEMANFNRQLYALDATLGRPKAEVAAERIRAINPGCVVEPLNLFVHNDTLDKVLAGRPDVVIDAIDSMNPKVALLSRCITEKTPVISCLGAALRRDPSCIRIGTLDRTRNCPLARMVRKRLRRQGLATDLTCVYSDEPVDDLPEEAVATGDRAGQRIIGGQLGRPRRVLGSLPTITGIFGLTAAHAALALLLGDDFGGAVRPAAPRCAPT